MNPRRVHRVRARISRRRVGRRLGLEIGVIDGQLGFPRDAGVDDALDVLGVRHSVGDLVLAHKIDLFEEDGGILDQPAGFPQRQVGLRIDPNLTLERADFLVPRLELENVDPLLPPRL